MRDKEKNSSKRQSGTLGFIRFLHTTIWIIMASAVFYVFYSGVFGRVSTWSWVAVGLIFLEGVALMIGKGDCPLHLYALEITGEKELNDTFLPKWIFFPGYKRILTVIFLIGLTLMIV